MEEYALSILVDNQGEVLSRISGLFSRKGYRINSLSFGKTENPQLSRMDIAFSSNSQFIDQIINQVKKVVDVREVVEVVQ